MFTLTQKELTAFAALGVAHYLFLALALVTTLLLFWVLAGAALMVAACYALGVTLKRHQKNVREPRQIDAAVA